MNYQVPGGTQDISPDEASKWRRSEELIRQLTYVYNYQEIRTPIFEHTNVFKRGNDSSDMVNKEMYTFQPENSFTSLTLRPEGTVGVARAFVEHKMYGYADLPMKMYYVGPQCRRERLQKGRMCIFNQFGIEVIGAKSSLLDVETIAFEWSFISALGLKDMKVLINTLGDDASRAAHREALKGHFKNDIDHICTDCKCRYGQNPLRILDCEIDHDLDIMKQVPRMADYLSEESKAHFEQVPEGLGALGIPYEVDDKLMHDLDYYTHTVFEVVSVNKEMEVQSTVFTGGRYDGFVEYSGGPEGMNGIGWAMGLERLLIALEAEGISLVDEDSLDAYILRLSPKVSTTVLRVVIQLRTAGYRTGTDYLNRSMKAQFKTVGRMHARVVIIIGEQDLESGSAAIKNTETKGRTEVAFGSIVEAIDTMFGEVEEEHTCTCEEERCTCQKEQ